MLQNSISIKNRHKTFINEVVKNKFVWGLKSEEGFATSTSNEFEDINENPIQLLCFWSDKKLAKVCAKDSWNEYKPLKINLSEFLENWCVGLYNDKLLVGTNFDWNLFGQENYPLELIIEITKELKKHEIELKFNKFEGVIDLEKQVKEILELEENE